MEQITKFLSTWKGKLALGVAAVVALIVFSDFLVSLFGA
jgi:hypothetical protein